MLDFVQLNVLGIGTPDYSKLSLKNTKKAK